MTFKKFFAALLASVMLCGTVATVAVNAADKTLPFTDVANDWAYEPIKYVYEKGLMNGTGGTNFSPKAPLTRAMVVTVLYRLAGSPTVYYKRALCHDLDYGKFYTDAVVWALENGVVTGTHTDDWGVPYFSPDRNITRQELATLFVRFANYQRVILAENGNISKFTDADKVASWAEEAMKWANSAGLINGTGDGTTLSPTGEATREQFAAITQRYCNGEFDHSVYYAEPETGNSYKRPVYELCNDADVYVAVDGNDKNPGTLDKPLATLEGARNKVRELKKTAKDEIVVAFKAGEYESPDNLTFTPEDTGTAEVPITYRVYGDGDVIFNGGFTVKANEFVPITDEDAKKFPTDATPYIKKADLTGKLPETPTLHNYLFSESTGMCWQARDLNRSGGEDKYVWNSTTEGDLRTCIKLQGKLAKSAESFSTYDGLWVKGQLCTGYTFDIFEVTGYDPETQLLYLDTANYHGCAANMYQPHTSFNGLATEGRMEDKLFFYNLPEFLDALGEYWIDYETETLYVYEPYGDYSYTRNGTFMTFEEGVNHINMIGLQFRGGYKDNMINLHGDYFTFDGCRFGSFSSMYAIWADGVNNFRFENCEVYNFPGHGLGMISNADRNNIVPAGNVIRNNYFHDYGSAEYWSDAVEVANDVATLIEHNEFKNAAHGGISYYDSIDIIIQYNIFDFLMHSTTDYGAIYTHRGCGFRDNIIRYNLFKNMADAAMTHSFYNDGAYGQIVYSNIFYNSCGDNICLNDGRDNVVNDNISIANKMPGGFGGFLMSYNPGPYLALTDEGKMVDVEGLIGHMNNIVKPGEEGYEKWYSRWEVMYKYDYSKESAGDFYSFYSTINYVKRNKMFYSTASKIGEYDLGPTAATFSGFDNIADNIEHPITENPYFKCPATGDYSIVNNADDFEQIYDFYKIGVMQ